MLSLGVRTDFSHQFGFMWMPKIAAKYNVNNRLALRADYSMGYTGRQVLRNCSSIGIIWECL
jgi:outer membrane receptor for ferrienterochelin and colicin